MFDLQNQFFMVKDVVPENIDRLGTYQQHLAPNLRKMSGPYPVYAMGQPTKDGLSNFMTHLREENFKVVDRLLDSVVELRCIFCRTSCCST